MDRTPKGLQPQSKFKLSDKYNRSSLFSELSSKDSQNIVLELSDSNKEHSSVSSFQYYKNKAQQKLAFSKVIVIGSSSEESSPEKAHGWNYLQNDRVSIIEESSSNDESTTDNERIQFSDTNDPEVKQSLGETINITEDNSLEKENLSDASHVSPTQKSVEEYKNSDPKYLETKSRFFVDEPISNITHRKPSNYKNIRSKRPFYFTDLKKATESTDSRADTKESESSDCLFEKDDEVQVVKSDSEIDLSVIPETPPDQKKTTKMDAPDVPPVTLSERKKNEIANWLLTNSPDYKRSSSHFTANYSNSGDSSLERFELKYETPNNRERIKKALSEKKLNDLRSKEKSTVQSVLKPIRSMERLDVVTSSTTDKVSTKKGDEINIQDCVDVLDNLYGSEWRKKADAILQSSEPRRQQPVSRIDRAVQTEKKKIVRSKYQIKAVSDSESDDEIFAKNIRNPSTTKTVRNKKQLDSFIDDRRSTDISGESIYHTAITNSRSSEEVPKPPSTMSAFQKVLTEICDPDTDEEVQPKVTKTKTVNRRRLLFTDEDSGGSCTSEFDPDDKVLPKFTPKKDHFKISHHPPKATVKTKTTTYESRPVKSFLTSLSSNVPMADAHPDAKVYRADFKNRKEELSRKLFLLYNENVFENKLPDDMPIEWSTRMTGTAGFCYNKKIIKSSGAIIRSSRIQLSTKVVDTPDRLRDSLIHEMCHAAAWIINEVSDGHGPYWRSWVSRAMRAFPELPEIKRCHDYKINTKYTYRCTGCGYSIGRHSKSLDVQKKRCGLCYGTFEVLINKNLKSGTVQVKTPSRSKEPSGFALYVKENYNSIKQNRRSMKHGEVMKILGQQFSAIKIATKRHDNVEHNSSGLTDA